MNPSRRSLAATLVSRYLHLTNKGYFDSEDAANAHMARRAAVQDLPIALPRRMKNAGAVLTVFQGVQVIAFGTPETAQQTIIHLHGGAYVNDVFPQHLTFCQKLSKKLNAHVLLPRFPLAPKYSHKDAYAFLERFYAAVCADAHGPVSLIGDSAGGGLALGFCQQLAATSLPQPDRLVLISPWVDISMSGEYDPEIEQKDAMLKVAGLKTIGRVWAADRDVRDPAVSPLFGSCCGLPRTLLFCGTHEILCGDVTACYETLRTDGVDARLILGEGLGHDYVLYPIPEAKRAMEEICAELQTQ